MITEKQIDKPIDADSSTGINSYKNIDNVTNVKIKRSNAIFFDLHNKAFSDDSFFLSTPNNLEIALNNQFREKVLKKCVNLQRTAPSNLQQTYGFKCNYSSITWEKLNNNQVEELIGCPKKCHYYKSSTLKKNINRIKKIKHPFKVFFTWVDRLKAPAQVLVVSLFISLAFIIPVSKIIHYFASLI